MIPNKYIWILKKVPPPEKTLFWFTILLIIKFTFLFFIIDQNRPTTIPGSVAICSGDCDSYLPPIDNLVEYGSYSPDFRMPGYGIPYFIFRSFTDKSNAANLLIIFQTLVDAIASLVLAFTAYRITRRKATFYLTILFYGAAITVSCYNNWILTESLTASSLIFGFGFIQLFASNKKNYWLFLSGLFFTWAYFLRPVNFPILILAAGTIFIVAKGTRIKSSIIFLLPAILINSIWTARNYHEKNKIFLLTETRYSPLFYSESSLECLNFCKTFSDFKITSCFFVKSGLKYFGQSVQTLKLDDIEIPDELYTKDFNLDSLLLIRQYFDEIAAPETSIEREKILDKIIAEKFRRYTESIEQNHPFLVQVKTPLILTRRFLLQSGAHNLFFLPFSFLSTSQKMAKSIFILIYWIVFISFLLGLILCSGKILENKLILLSYAIAFYIIFIHSIFLRSIEFRYIIPAYPFFVIGAVFFINSLIKPRPINKI